MTAPNNYDIGKLNSSLQNLKDQLKNLMAVSADLIDKNSQIDSGLRNEPIAANQNQPKFELLLEDFLGSCNTIELNLRTIQECLQLSKASLQNLPMKVDNTKSDNLDSPRVEPIEPGTNVSYNQYLSTIRYQVDTAKAIKSILEDFVNQQGRQSSQIPSVGTTTAAPPST